MKPKDKVLYALGLTIAGLAIMAMAIAVLYSLIVQAGEIGARWWALIATLALPAAVIITYRLATHAAREHLAGFDRGLTGAQRTVETMGRSLAATASLAKTSSPQNRAHSFNDLLPQPGMKIVDDHPDDSGVVDL